MKAVVFQKHGGSIKPIANRLLGLSKACCRQAIERREVFGKVVLKPWDV